MKESQKYPQVKESQKYPQVKKSQKYPQKYPQVIRLAKLCLRVSRLAKNRPLVYPTAAGRLIELS